MLTEYWPQMGKRVLRPGDKGLTLELIDALNISPKDELIELAPGTGFTAKVALQNNPESYTAIERDQQAADSLKRNSAGSYTDCQSKRSSSNPPRMAYTT